jgi:5-methylcytosine-specific restriction endonuclease McrA
MVQSIVCKIHGLISGSAILKSKERNKIRYRCKECRYIYNRQYTKDNKAKLTAYKKQYAITNKDKIKSKAKRYYKDNKAIFIQRTITKRFGATRQAIFDRDNYKCVNCNMTNNEHKAKWAVSLTINHIDGNGRNSITPNNNLNNLELLCLKCHGAKDSKRYWYDKKCAL